MAVTSFLKNIGRKRSGKTAGTKKKPAAGEARVKRRAAESKRVTPRTPGQPSMALAIGLTPLFTEKSLDLQGKHQVVFRVSRQATKGQVRQALLEVYQATAVSIRTVLMRGKTRRRGKTTGRTNNWKKAYVSVTDIKAFNVTP
jgi:large subunit ribosomal protein L23